MESRGVVYIATGQKFVDEALISARSVRKTMGSVPIVLFTDLEHLVIDPPEPVNEVILMTDVRKSCLDKMYPLLDTPFERTLFLDTDTYVCDKVDELFEILDHFDVAVAHPPYRVQYQIDGIPECFPEPNTGVIAFRRSPEALKAIGQWPVEYERQQVSGRKPHHDQHSFRVALYQSEARVLILPHEYNFRNIGPNFAGKGSRVKIIHGRHASYERLEKRLNSHLNYRVFLSHPGRIFTSEFLTYKSSVEALSNYLFEHLPGSLQSFLSTFRKKISS